MSANITICTPARDAAGLIARYRAQIAALVWPQERLRVLICEGDSQDDTAALLHAWAAEDSRVMVVHCTTGMPHYPSVVDAQRFALLARVFNTALAAVDLDWSDCVLFLPVDIRYDPDMLARLVQHNVDLIAPLVFQDGAFYDIWAFSRGGRDFAAFSMSDTERLCGRELLRMDTIGGTVLLRAAVLQAGIRYTATEVDRGLSKAARAQGFSVWCDPTVWVEHQRRTG